MQVIFPVVNMPSVESEVIFGVSDHNTAKLTSHFLVHHSEQMRYVAAYLLATLGGKDKVTAGDVEKILSSVGIEVDSEKLSLVIKSLAGKNLEELIAAGREKLSALPAGGAAAAPAAAGAAAPAAAAAAEKKEEKSEWSTIRGLTGACTKFDHILMCIL